MGRDKRQNRKGGPKGVWRRVEKRFLAAGAATAARRQRGRDQRGERGASGGREFWRGFCERDTEGDSGLGWCGAKDVREGRDTRDVREGLKKHSVHGRRGRQARSSCRAPSGIRK
ncbi:unnamed protein product [Coccothraustes coccothraustes]